MPWYYAVSPLGSLQSSPRVHWDDLYHSQHQGHEEEPDKGRWSLGPRVMVSNQFNWSINASLCWFGNQSPRPYARPLRPHTWFGPVHVQALRPHAQFGLVLVHPWLLVDGYSQPLWPKHSMVSANDTELDELLTWNVWSAQPTSSANRHSTASSLSHVKNQETFPHPWKFSQGFISRESSL